MDHTFHSDTLHEVLSRLETDQEQGLSLQEGEKRLAEHGENRLEEAKQAGMLRRVLGQLKDPMILVLLAAAALSFFAGGGQDWLDAAIILLIVLFNTVISVSQEDNARKALEALRKLSAPKARVIRAGLERRLESSQLVPGDIILLEAGDYVPADGRVLWEAGLQADESAMTGESLPVHKRGGGGLPQDTPLAERKNMVIGGTVITGGRGRTLENRLRMLGIDHFYVDCMDKITAIREYMAGQGLDPANVIYMGDDIPDLDCMREVGLPVCPADAAAEVIEASRYVSEFRGGEGAVRDIVEQVLRARGDWARDSQGVTPSSLAASR